MLHIPCVKWMELGCQVLLVHFRPVDLLYVSKMMMKNVASKSNLALGFMTASNYLLSC